MSGNPRVVGPSRTDLIGRVLKTVSSTIREDDLQMYLPVAGEEHAAFSNDEAAKAVGYARRVAPPPFVAVQALLRTFDWETDFRFDYRIGTAMFGEQELEYRRPLYVGETLTVRTEVTDVYEKQGKRRFDVIQVSFTAADESGDIAFHDVQSYIPSKEAEGVGARSQLFFEDVRVGLQLPQTTYGPMDRSAYIPVAIILRDTNPLHLDRGYARERGLPDVVQQGPLNETFLYRFLTALLYRPWDLRRTKLRFAANVFPGDLLTCGGIVTRTSRADDEPRVECDVWQRNQNGETILSGAAAFTLPERGPR